MYYPHKGNETFCLSNRLVAKTYPIDVGLVSKEERKINLLRRWIVKNCGFSAVSLPVFTGKQKRPGIAAGHKNWK